MTSSQENGKISMATDGMNYAPAPMPQPVVEPGDFTFSVAALDHGHIFGTDGEGFERLNIACPWQTLARGLTQLAAAFRDR